MSDVDERLRNLWRATLGDTGAADGWSTLSGGATYRSPTEESPSTLSGGATVAPTLSGGVTVAPTLSGGGTIGDAAAGLSTSTIGVGGFQLLEEIGRGGMGVVWKARQASLARDVAVKLIKAEAVNERSRRGFVAEALVNGVLDHPNIVPVHELGTTAQGEAFLAMKLVGGTAWDRLLHPRTAAERTRAETYDLDKHLAVLEAVANAVAFAHSRGIVHRDLKPENVMVGEYGEVLVMDWGIAVDIRDRPDPADSRTTHKSAIRSPAGTPNYMASELAEGRGTDIGPWTDVYLLGAILCEILRGTPPHQGNTLMAILLAASRSEPPVFPAGTPSGLVAICHRALARDHTARYPNVPALQSALAEYRKHRESDRIATTAQAALARCEGSDAAALDGAGRAALYGNFAEAVAGFRQALALWPENPTAVAGEREARARYATAALAAGDLALAEAQAAPLHDAELSRRIADARAARAAQDRAATRNRRLLVGSALVIVIGLTAGVLLVNAQRSRAVSAEQDAITQRDAARAAEQEAEQRRQQAEQADWKSRNLAAASLARAQALMPQAEAALALAVAREVHPDTAPAGLGGGPGVAHDAWLRFRYAPRSPRKALWDAAIGAPIRDVVATDFGIVVVPERGPVQVRDRGDGSLLHLLSGIDGADLAADRGTMFANGGFVAVHEEDRIRVWGTVDGTIVLDHRDRALTGGIVAPDPSGSVVVHAYQHHLRVLDRSGAVVAEADLEAALIASREYGWRDGRWHLTPKVLSIGADSTPCGPIRVLLGGYTRIGSIWESAVPTEDPIIIEWTPGEDPVVHERQRGWEGAYAAMEQRVPAGIERPLQVDGMELHHRDGLLARARGVDYYRDGVLARTRGVDWRIPLTSAPVAWDRVGARPEGLDASQAFSVVVAQADELVSCWRFQEPEHTVTRIDEALANGSGLRLSGDGSRMLVVTYDDTAIVNAYAFATGKIENRLVLSGNVMLDAVLAWDGSWLAAINGNEVQTMADQEMAGNGAFVPKGLGVIYVVGQAEPMELTLPEGCQPRWLEAGPAGDLLVGTDRGVLRYARVGAALAAQGELAFGDSTLGRWSADGHGFAVLTVTGEVVVGVAATMREARRLPTAVRRIGLDWGPGGSLLVGEEGGWIATYDPDGQLRHRLRTEVPMVRGCRTVQGGTLLLSDGVLANPRDGMVLRRGLNGAISADATAVTTIDRLLHDGEWSTVLVRESLVPGDVPAELPPLHGGEATWAAWADGLDYRLVTEGAYAGEVVPAALVDGR